MKANLAGIIISLVIFGGVTSAPAADPKDNVRVEILNTDLHQGMDPGLYVHRNLSAGDPRGASNEHRVGHQSQDRQEDRPESATEGALSCRSRHSVEETTDRRR